MLASLRDAGDIAGMFLADAGVPMIVVQWPLMFAALLPVIALEAWILQRQLALPFGRAVRGSALASLASTLAVVPIASAVMLGVRGTYEPIIPNCMPIAASPLDCRVT